MQKFPNSYAEFSKIVENYESKIPFISSNSDVFMVKFYYDNEVIFINNHSNELSIIANLPSKNDRGLEYIKRFENGNFIKLSKSEIITLFGNNTENMIALQSLGIAK